MASRLMGAGGISAEFENIGDFVDGILIEEPGEAQQTEYQDKTKLKFYRNGQPAMMSILRLQTDQRISDEDDGIRILCVADLSDRQRAIATAVRGAGCSDVEVGGRLRVEYYADGTPKEKGNRPPKLYRAQWTPPQKQSGLMAGAPQQQQQQQPQYQQQQQPVQQQAQPQQQVAGLPPGMDPAAVMAALANLGIQMPQQ